MPRVNKKPWLGIGDKVKGNDLLFAPENVEQRLAVLLTLFAVIFLTPPGLKKALKQKHASNLMAYLRCIL